MIATIIPTTGTLAVAPRSNPMRRLVYVSRSFIDADPATLDAMVRESSVRNVAVGITGMLWFDGSYFAQVLEGEHDQVCETMKRIRSDPRHSDLEVVLDQEVKGRAFGKWGMAQPNNGPESMASTAFLVGLSITRRGHAAKRLHDIVVACEA